MTKILITGCAGFIGMHLSICLLNEGFKIIGIDNLNNYYDVKLKKARLNLLKKYPNFIFYKTDIKNKLVHQIFLNEEPPIVVHLAAQAGVRYSITNPEKYIDSNIHGFLNILEACRSTFVKHLIYASSSSVYGNNTNLPLKEISNTDCPLNIYAATKKTNELMAHVYNHLYEIPTTGLRFFTVYGPWGRPDMAFFKFVSNILSENPIKIHNNGNMLRDFTYIDDLVEAIHKIIKKPAINSNSYNILNIGSNHPIKLLKYIEVIENELGIKAKKIFVSTQPGEIINTHACTKKLKTSINFEPLTPIEIGIKHFINWYKTFY